MCGLGMERRVVPPVSFKADPIVHLWIKHRLADRMPVLWGPVKLSSIDALCEWGPPGREGGESGVRGWTQVCRPGVVHAPCRRGSPFPQGADTKMVGICAKACRHTVSGRT